MRAEHQWIRDLEAWLRQAVPQYPSVKFLGMCFGCQVLATALGGSVGKNPDGGFVLKVENICLREQLQRSAALRLAAADVASSGGESSSSDCSDSGGAAASPVPSVCLIQSHGDAVLRLPPGATLLAESSTAAVEIFGLPNVLAVQVGSGWSREG